MEEFLDQIHIKYPLADTLYSTTAKTMCGCFKEWLQLTEAIFDPKITNPEKFQNYEGKPYLSRDFALTLDNKGNIIPYDYKTNKPHLVMTSDRRIQLHQLGPQSKKFRQIINALRSKHPDIDKYTVEHYFMSGHMQGGNGRYRTVAYWMSRPEVRLANKMPKYFYHGTSTNLWYEGIKEKGLAPRRLTGSTGGYGSQNVSALSHSDLVYLSTDPDAATRTAAKQAANKYGGSPLIIRINTTGLDPSRLAPDEDTGSVTAQGSVDVSSTLAYRGRIPSSNLEPFLLAEQVTLGSRIQTKWKKFKDVPVTEHPVTAKLKKGEFFSYDDPEYIALLDAGIIGEEEVRDDRGFPNRRQVILDKDITDEKIKKILKNSYWTQNFKLIQKDLGNGYRGVLYQLKNIEVPKEKLDDPILKMLIDSGLVIPEEHKDKIYLDVSSWNTQPYAIKLAKAMGRMNFEDLMQKVKNIT